MAEAEKPKRTTPVSPTALERERLRLAWSIEKLAAESGVDVKTIRRLMKGGNAYFSTVDRVAKAMAISARVLTLGIGAFIPSPQEKSLNTTIRTVGEIQNRDQLEQVVTATNEYAARLQAAGITIVSHKMLLSPFPNDDSGVRIVLSMERNAVKLKPPPMLEVLGVAPLITGMLSTCCWFFVAVRPAKLAEVLRNLENDRFDLVDFSKGCGEILALGPGSTPKLICEVADKLNPRTSGT
jgi:transcriptional regulator with XRE-family HTH domain